MCMFVVNLFFFIVEKEKNNGLFFFVVLWEIDIDLKVNLKIFV